MAALAEASADREQLTELAQRLSSSERRVSSLESELADTAHGGHGGNNHDAHTHRGGESGREPSHGLAESGSDGGADHDAELQILRMELERTRRQLAQSEEERVAVRGVVLGGMVLVVDVTWRQALAAADSDNTVNGPSESDLRKKVRPAAGAVGTNGSLSHRVWCRMRSWRPLRRSLQLSSER